MLVCETRVWQSPATRVGTRGVRGFGTGVPTPIQQAQERDISAQDHSPFHEELLANSAFPLTALGALRGFHCTSEVWIPPDFIAGVMMVWAVLSISAQTAVITQKQCVYNNNSRSNFQPCYPRPSSTKIPPHLLNSEYVYEIIFCLLTRIGRISAAASRHCWSQPLLAPMFFQYKQLFVCALLNII